MCRYVCSLVIVSHGAAFDCMVAVTPPTIALTKWVSVGQAAGHINLSDNWYSMRKRMTLFREIRRKGR